MTGFALVICRYFYNNGFMKKVLLIGGSGFLGTELIATRPDGVDLVSTFFTAPNEELVGKWTFLDFFKPDQVAKTLSDTMPDTVLFVARLKPAEDQADSARCIEPSLKELAVFAKKHGTRVLFMSSDAVFDGKKGNYSESNKTRPMTNYGQCKLWMENFIRSSLSNYLIIRTSYIFGKNAFGYDKRTSELILKSKDAPVSYFSAAFRAPIHVTKLARCCWQLVQNEYRGVVHVAGKRMSLYDFARVIARQSDVSQNLIIPNSISTFKNSFPIDTSLDSGLAKKLLNGDWFQKEAF